MRLASAISSSTVTPREAFLAYFAVFQPAISYVLSLSTFTRTQCHQLQVKPTQLFLQKCGFVSNMKRAIVFGARQSGGLGFRHPFVEQGVAQLLKLIQTLRTPGPPKRLLLLCLQEWQVNSGMSYPLLALPCKPCPHLEGSWLSSIRQFLASINGSVTIAHSLAISIQREHDQHIMDALIRCTKFSTKRMKRLNSCRLFLQVTLLSELTNPSGTHLCSQFWCGLGPRPYSPLLRYPRQGCPSSSVWSEWRAAIRRAFCFPYTLKLRQSLGRWYTPAYCRITSPSSRPLPVMAPAGPPISRILLNVSHRIPLSLLRHRIYHPRYPLSIICACDGSASSTNAAFGWVIRTGTTDLVSCYGPSDGICTAYRAECVGALSLLTFLSQIVNRPLASHVPIYIDNASLCNRLHRHQSRCYYSPNEATSPERDLLLQLEHLIDSIPAVLIIRHIKSHQDKTRPAATLSHPAQANCRADALALQGLLHSRSHSYSSECKQSVCQLHVSNQTITSHIPSTIRRLAYEQSLKRHILTSRPWSDTSHIDWTVFQQLNSRNSHRLVFYLKWIHLLLPTGKLLHRRNPRESPLCPACGSLEDNDHFVTCPHPSRRASHITLISSLRRYLTSSLLDSILADILIEGVNSLFTGIPFNLSRYPSEYHALCLQQSNLGWINLMRGFISTQWSHLASKSCIPNVSPTSILVSCLHLLCSSVQSIWKLRCDQRHSTSLRAHENEIRRQVHQEITELYTHRYQVLPTDRRIFHSSLSSHLKQSTCDLQAWLTSHRSIIRDSVIIANQQNLAHTAPITTFFPMS